MMASYFLGGILGVACGTFLVGFLLRRFARLPVWLAAAIPIALTLWSALARAFVHRPSLAISEGMSGGREAHLGLVPSIARVVIGGVIAYWFLRRVKPRPRNSPSVASGA